ncbi:MAG: glycosyltransferase family 4 protein, partial [Actinomycetota bacterium]|nr:glycosyltransferase family 4 protein [Actinomycetota bacterium]
GSALMSEMVDTGSESPRSRGTILRLSSVFATPDGSLSSAGSGFDVMGGMQVHTAQMTMKLDELGFEQTILTAKRPAAPARERVGERSELIRLGLPIKSFRQLYSVPLFNLASCLAARCDLVHAHAGEDLAVLPIAYRAASKYRVPLVVTLHCSLAHTIQPVDARTRVLKSFGGLLERSICRKADAVIALTERVAEALARDGVSQQRIHVVPPGADPHPPVGEWPWPHIRSPRVVFVGRLVHQKGIFTLLQAAANLPRDINVVFVGDGPDRTELERRARDLGLSDRVTVTGFVPHRLIPSVMAGCDLLVLPSTYEELGRVLVEAMQLGVPVVASRVGGIPEVIQDGYNGLLVEPEQPLPLAKTITRVIRDGALARSLREAALTEGTQYSWERVAQELVAVYDNVLAQAPQHIFRTATAN